ncbi:MAG: hypothetical protein ACYTKC_00310 [Planctomycetota bacterium]|jgi:hypothetical protein
MIAWILWLFVALHLFLLDGFLKQVLVLPGGLPVAPDLTVCIGLFLGLFARPSALPGLLFCAALSRSVFLPGSVFWHMLVLGIPVALLLPLRVVFSQRSPLWQCAAAGFLAYVMPRLAGLLFRLTAQGDAMVHTTAADVFVAMCLVPMMTWVLRALPPLSLFEEELR